MILAFCARYWRQIALLALVCAVAWWIVAEIHSYGAGRFEAGRQQVLAADALAAAAGRAQADQHVTDAAAAGVALHLTLNSALPKLEVDTHDAITNIRTIYLAQPSADPVCSRPAGVQTELDTARSRANAAARGDL